MTAAAAAWLSGVLLSCSRITYRGIGRKPGLMGSNTLCTPGLIGSYGHISHGLSCPIPRSVARVAKLSFENESGAKVATVTNVECVFYIFLRFKLIFGREKGRGDPIKPGVHNVLLPISPGFLPIPL